MAAEREPNRGKEALAVSTTGRPGGGALPPCSLSFTSLQSNLPRGSHECTREESALSLTRAEARKRSGSSGEESPELEGGDCRAGPPAGWNVRAELSGRTLARRSGAMGRGGSSAGPPERRVSASPVFTGSQSQAVPLAPIIHDDKLNKIL
ncbi:hypothetical protein NDU88_003280 [Pleurodeles waltl]|uniref:Uncharacterized protein n=1 Tax=Pleurodeles waltl TaxID=8319 RepID=A0AAV7L5M9_PLEWA|nr:hypothetical protein NDU88_003280 [Pleurodeles waltl]